MSAYLASARRGLVFVVDAVVALTLAVSLAYAIFHAVNVGEPTSWYTYRAYRLGEATLTVFEKSGLLENVSRTMDDAARTDVYAALGRSMPDNFAARLTVVTDSSSIEVTHPYSEHLGSSEDTYISKKSVFYFSGGQLRRSNVTLQLWGIHKTEWGAG